MSCHVAGKILKTKEAEYRKIYKPRQIVGDDAIECGSIVRLGLASVWYFDRGKCFRVKINRNEEAFISDTKEKVEAIDR